MFNQKEHGTMPSVQPASSPQDQGIAYKRIFDKNIEAVREES